MSVSVFYSNEPEDQQAVCEFIIAELKSHPIALFYGEMGAGKTSLIKNICNLLGLNDAVSSPTFSLVNEYESKQAEPIYHFDFYRINDPKEALEMACEDYFYSGSICFIEWPERIESILPEKHLSIQIQIEGEKRKITIRKQN